MIRRAGPDDMAAVLEIRRIVFIKGQNVSEADERDGRDADAIHLIAFADGTPVGTARILLADGTGKIGRVAVLEAHRGTGLGKALMAKALEVLREEGAVKAKLSAQTQAIGFYEALGFTAHGPKYLDAGIPHRDMTRAL
jgi:ElaA protein